LASNWSTPSLLKPMRLMIACRSGMRNIRGLGVPRLRARGDGAHFDEAETQRGQGVDVIAVLVEASRQAHRVGEVEPHHPYRIRRHGAGQQTGGTGHLEEVDPGHSEAVRGLGIEGEEDHGVTEDRTWPGFYRIATDNAGLRSKVSGRKAKASP
jgi:hypothetical protein